MTDSQQQAFPRLDTPLIEAREVPVSADGKHVLMPGSPISIPWYRLIISLWNRTGGSSGGGSVQTGAAMVWLAPGALPDGWLECDGTAVSRTIYSALFNVIGVTWGAGDGSSTFNLPDFRDRFPAGVSGTKPVGQTGGANSITLAVGQLPAHSHTITDPGHSHTQQVNNNNTAGAAGSQGGNAANNASVGTTDSATTGITATDSTGTGNPIDITPAYAAVRWMIKS